MHNEKWDYRNVLLLFIKFINYFNNINKKKLIYLNIINLNVSNC